MPPQAAEVARRWLTPRQRQVVAAAAAAVGVLAAYKVYRSERLKATHAALSSAADTLGRYHAAASSAGEVVAVLAQDIRSFLASDADEVPRSLRQLAKLARCDEVQQTVAAFVASSIRGAVSSSSSSSLGGGGGGGAPGEPSVVDKVIEAVLSDRGQSLVGLAVRTAACQSTEVFCAAVRQGMEAALQAAGVGGGGQQQQQQQRQPGAAALLSPLSPGPGGAFYSATSSPLASPQGRYYYASPHSVYGGGSGGGGGQHQTAAGALHPLVGSVLALLCSPQLLQAVDGLVSTTVGSTVGAYLAQAGSSTDMLTSALHMLAQPANKQLVIDIMSQVSAVCCREMAAACVAPAAAVVGSRPASRLSDSPGLLEAQQQQQQQQLLLQERLAAAVASPARVPAAPKQPQDALLHHSVSDAALAQQQQQQQEGASADGAHAEDGAAGSEPSSPQSGPSTPEPSVAAAEAAAGPGTSAWQQQQPRRSSYGSFAGSAVAGLILRRPSIGGMGWGGAGANGGAVQQAPACGGVAGAALVDPAALGPLSTVVTLFVQAARFQEFRSLMVDVSRSSTREFVLSLLPSGWAGAVHGGGARGRRHGGGDTRSNQAAAAALTAALYRVYAAVSVLLFLMVYALGPRTLLLEG